MSHAEDAAACARMAEYAEEQSAISRRNGWETSANEWQLIAQGWRRLERAHLQGAHL
ncbi:TPA: hypothetical protein UMT99_000755 [Stenotrophomonas maltophilia]|uniref:hypothetical protein n=1 Tax=Stenotrophomonas TaxID=40323 RepID=UPI0013D97A55|nr:hypothetical protein [Stenotrophomonas maltophilia]HEL3804684.1 hypothetical protein [Stenotrophomonas maltophilia]